MATTLLHFKRSSEIKLSVNDVYIGKRLKIGKLELSKSKWVNPFSEKEFGNEKAINYYRNHLEYRLYHELDLLNELEMLKGKQLICFCRNKVCHGTIIIEFINRLLER